MVDMLPDERELPDIEKFVTEMTELNARLLGVHMSKVVIFKGKGVQPWRWKMVSNNGEIVAQSEGYLTKWNVKRSAKKEFPEHLIVDETEQTLVVGYKRDG